ncbi:MAG: site-specific DNA-methyltransferase, partial [Bacteroidales bacterium]|nr:site-specific DNA-methyltransferase [Bacteroidales bacterium]
MDKLNLQTHNIVDENIKKIAELFPNCLTERLDENGKPEAAIDFDQLRQELSKDIVEGPEERYQFTWPDKRNAIRLANAPTTDTLRPCREESVDFDNTQNLYIEGDNLEVLKLLRENYLGKVKMIYIDPPYNTGNDFVYNDDFAQTAGNYIHNSGQEDEEGNRLVANTESNGRFHTDWLNMIYPRLKVAKDLLSEDGVIFISIDDNEQENLKKICDEVFGAGNYIANLVWQKKTGASDAVHLATITENILVYSRHSANLKLKQNDSAYDPKRYKYQDEFFDIRGPFYYDSLDRGTLGYHESLDYGVEAPDGTMVFPNGRTKQQNDGWRWKWGKDKLAWGVKNKFIEVRKNGDKWGVYYKIYLNVDNDGNTIKRTSPFKNLIQNVLNTHAASESKSIWGRTDLFSNPKPIELIKFFVDLSNNDKGIVLDFFSGSATTAHAVMQLNAEDGGKRKFIMVQLPEKTDEKSEAYKAGYKNICEIGKERIHRAGKKIVEEQEKKRMEEGLFAGSSTGSEARPLDIGFRVLKLDSSNMQDVYYSPEQFNENLLFEDNIKHDRTDEDLLFQAMIELGIELSAKIEQREIAGKTVWSVADNYLMACFDKDVNETTITEIARQHPYYFVL